MWEQLTNPWQVCLDEAWHAYCAGSLPIGAVIVGQDREMLSRGRNRIYQPKDLPFGAKNHEIMHAELQCTLALDQTSITSPVCGTILLNGALPNVPGHLVHVWHGRAALCRPRSLRREFRPASDHLVHAEERQESLRPASPMVGGYPDRLTGGNRDQD